MPTGCSAARRARCRTSGSLQKRGRSRYCCSRPEIARESRPSIIGGMPIALRKEPTVLHIPNCAEIDVAPEFLCLACNACGARARQLHETMAALALEDNQ